MENLFTLTTFIALFFYGWNIIADANHERPLSIHLGYAIISIVGLWQINVIVAIFTLIIACIYSLINFLIWLESIKSKRHE